jgi:hypothetical protein
MASENRFEGDEEGVFSGFDVEGVAEVVGEGGDGDACEAAGDDRVVASKVRVDVEGEAVRGYAALDSDADGAELGNLSCAAARPSPCEERACGLRGGGGLRGERG